MSTGANVGGTGFNLTLGTPTMGKKCEGALTTFLYWVSAIVIGQAVYAALLASWQEGHYTAIATAWANAGLLLGVMLVVWMIYCWRNPG